MERRAPRVITSVLGGQHAADGATPTARHIYYLGAARDPDGRGLIVNLMGGNDPSIGITFEAKNFDDAHRRAIEISSSMAEAAGYLDEGVAVVLMETPSIKHISLGD